MPNTKIGKYNLKAILFYAGIAAGVLAVLLANENQYGIRSIAIGVAGLVFLKASSLVG